MGMQAVDLAIQNGVDLDGTPIPQKMLDLYNRIMDEENKRQRSGVKKSMRNRCIKTGFKHFDKKTLNQLLDLLGNRTVVIGRELTKLYEEIIRGNLREIIEYFSKTNVKGEIVIMIGKDDDRINF